MTLIPILLLLCCVYSEQRSTPSDSSYVAAVLEYQVQADVDLNVQSYVQYIQEAAAQDADVVVFPEMTLTRGSRSVPVPINSLLKEYSVPALHPELYDEILVSLSTAASQSQVYVVVNIQEVLDCTVTVANETCPEDKVYLFNTNVVFDRTGAVVDRYRKINLFGEYSRTPALDHELGVFTTDFGVTFGHFICFDLMFQVPAVQIVQKNNIRDVIFTTMWFSEMPYLTAVQIQEAYAYALDINFLASGANNVRVGSAGSGIFSGRAGALVSIMPGVNTTRLLVARVPKIPGQVTETYPGPIYDNPSDHDGLRLKIDPSLPSHTSRLLQPGFQEFTLIDKEVTCRFRVRLTEPSGDLTPRYRAFVHDGSNTYVRREIGVVGCLVVACQTDDVKSCPYRIQKNEKNLKINELEIKMTTYRHHYNDSLNCDDILFYPSTLQTNKFPLSPKNFTFTDSRKNGAEIQDGAVTNGRGHVTFNLNMPQDAIVSFGIWGRIFNKDVDHDKQQIITEDDVNNYLEIEHIIYGIKEENI